MAREFIHEDSWHLAAGTHTRLWEVLGSHPTVNGKDRQTTFRVWAPNAQSVSVVGDGNGWTAGQDVLDADPSGVWRGTFAGYEAGSKYKFAILPSGSGDYMYKADPFAFACEVAPATASIVTDTNDEFLWTDTKWMQSRHQTQHYQQPVSIYELHLGSWRFEPGGYEALGKQITQYCVDMGFTHVELMPVTEHPFYGSWGYQVTGFFAPTSRYGSPEEFKKLVDTLHGEGIGVLLDWVPAHFPTDAHGLGLFDGTHLYEHADPRQGFHPDWTSHVFNYGRSEVKSFLLSSAHYWVDQFHIDGLRVDGVASMLYLDYSRKDGEWIPNQYGGNENFEAIAFLKELNRSLYEKNPDLLIIAEESTAWPGVTGTVDSGGLGFGYKWDMGWMHDTLSYVEQEPVHRWDHHDKITFRSVYATSESYVLPLSHDEVVHGKGSLLSKMPGDRWQQFANLRMLFGYQWALPGKKMLFMGCEFGSPDEWDHEQELPWALLGDEKHAGMQGWVRELNSVYKQTPALHMVDRDASGFQWVTNDDRSQSVLAFLRYAPKQKPVLVMVNATPVVRHGYRVGVPYGGQWQLLANSDNVGYGGSGQTPGEMIEANDAGSHGFGHSLDLTLPPLSVCLLALQ